IGLFYPFIDEESVRMYGLEAAGLGVDTHKTAATLTKGEKGILHGTLSYLLQDEGGQVELAHSISAGLDYPGIGPEHAYLRDSGRVHYAAITDEQAMDGVKLLSEQEGIIPALETAHAVAYLDELMLKTEQGEIMVLNCFGRGAIEKTTCNIHIMYTTTYNIDNT